MASPITLKRTRDDVFGVPIDVADWDTAVSRLDEWGAKNESRVICICNVHSVVTAKDDPAFKQAIASSDMATPDGAPVAWVMRRHGHRGQKRINGPDLMWRYCGHAARTGRSMYFYGGAPETLDKLANILRARWPQLKIAGMHSPPFRTLTPEEDEAVVERINASGAGVVWVSLGCPKQELWMHAHKGRIKAVMIGVGAAFDYHAGTLRRAPLWMQRHALEWFYRWLMEPRRLFKRYAVTNARFIWFAMRDLAFAKRF